MEIVRFHLYCPLIKITLIALKLSITLCMFLVVVVPNLGTDVSLCSYIVDYSFNFLHLTFSENILLINYLFY